MTDSAGAATLADGRPAFYPNPTAYVRDLGFSKQTATNWKRDGLIVFVDDPARPGRQLVDTAASDAKRAADQNPLKRQAPAPAADDTTDDTGGELALDASAPPAKPAAPADPHKKSAAEAVARTKWIELRDKEIAQRTRMGELCRTADARALVFRALRLARDTVLRAPMDCCEAANPDEPAKAREAIAADLSRKLSAVAVQVEAMLAGEAAPWDDAAESSAPASADADAEPADA